MHLKRSQWAVVAALTFLVAAPLISAAVLHHRIEHPDSGSLGLYNLKQPVRTVVVARDWELNMFIGSESRRRNNAPNQPIREGDFLDTMTDRSVEIYNPTGTAGLFEQYVAQRGDTLFFRAPNLPYPLQARLNLAACDSLTIISQGQVKVATLPETSAPLPVAHVDLRLSGRAFLRWHGTEVQTMTVEASDYTGFDCVVRSDNALSTAQHLTVTATNRSQVKVRGSNLAPNQVDFTLLDEAAFVLVDHYTATRHGTLAHQ